MGWLAAQGAFLFIGLALGFVFMVIGLFQRLFFHSRPPLCHLAFGLYMKQQHNDKAEGEHDEKPNYIGV